MISQPTSRLDNLKPRLLEGVRLGIGIAFIVIVLALINAFASTRLRLTDIYFVNEEVMIG